MTSNPDKQLKEEMLRAMLRPDTTRWSLPIVNKLESRSLGYAFAWACESVRSQLTRFSSAETLLQRDRWLAELLEMAATRGVIDDLDARARDVWYHKGARDGAQTAIARLYEAFGRLSAGDTASYRRALASAVIVAASDAGGQVIPTAVDTMVELYNKCESSK